MVASIPMSELVEVRPKMSKSEIERQWAEHFFTRKTKQQIQVKQDLTIQRLNKALGKDPRLKIYKD